MEFDSDALTELAIGHGIQLLIGLVTLVVGLYIVGIVVRVIRKMFERSGFTRLCGLSLAA